MVISELIFGKFSAEDIKSRVKALNNYETIHGIFIDAPTTIYNTEAWFENVRQDNNRHDFVLRNAGNVVGFSGLVNINYKNRSCELYIFLAVGSSGKGLGSHLLECTLNYAKCELNLRKITLYVTEGNLAALGLYKKFGFFKEGQLSRHSWHRGKYVDRYIYSLFLEDFSSELDIYKAMQ